MCKSQELGFISEQYEDGKQGCNAISSTPKDPGGASYGDYQLASKTGTLQQFLSFSKQGYKFKQLIPGTPTFNNMWLECAKDKAFCEEQHEFILQTHFTPIYIYWKDVLALYDSRAIQEALWSIGVQHGKWSKIVNAADAMLPDPYTEEDCINCLFQVRCDYVKSLKLAPNIETSLLNRYKNEKQDVLKLMEN